MTFGVFPNPGVVVGTLPVSVDVQDQGLIVSNNKNLYKIVEERTCEAEVKKSASLIVIPV